MPPETRVYGEGFQMLSQTGGTLGQPADLGDYTDARHYKLPQAEGTRVVYGLLTLAPPGAGHLLLAFTSCHRFSGELRLRGPSLEVVVDTEGRELRAGETWELEGVTFQAGTDREALLAELAGHLAARHPPLRFPAPPSGWCSWYCFGPRVTAAEVLANLEAISRSVPGLKLRADRRRLPAGHGGLAGNGPGLRRRRAGSAEADPRATRVEAYRRGMEAIRRGAEDAFILGCNHPLWASLGLLHGSRSSNDIERTWARIAGTARQNLGRNWQNGRLWWNDPDTLVLTAAHPRPGLLDRPGPRTAAGA